MEGYTMENNNKKYDVGIVGWWYNLNYGGTLTYFALNNVISELGYSVLMIQRSCPKNYTPQENTVPRRFANKHYNISDRYTFDELTKLNQICDRFVVGSDQLWNPNMPEYSGPEFFLSFAEQDKIKVAYATSFGNVDHCDSKFIEKYKPYLHDFDHISVREKYSVDMCQSDFDLKVAHVCDPIFLCDKQVFDKASDESKLNLPQTYVVQYLLDPNPEKMKACRYIREKLKLNRHMNFTDLQDIEARIKAFEGEDVNANAEIEDLLKAYKNADFIITDSFHGTCLAIIFNKPFISIANKQRGEKRFVSLMENLSLSTHLLHDIDDLYKTERFFESPNYRITNEIVNLQKNRGLIWLKNALSHPVKKKPLKILAKPAINTEKAKTMIDEKVSKLYSNPDFIKIRILGTLLRDYGIKHIVISPGGRDVPLVRMFEYNEDHFILHYVTDERSAAYYGLGIAAQLQKPVACVCTSGTAVSNYLPAVTEAFFTGVPLILITADRYDVYHGQGEDQTIPQKNVFQDVIKREVTLPELSGYRAEYQTRRDISDCILETTHHTPGPVHINVGIGDIGAGANVDRQYWKILPWINPHILRVGLNDGNTQLERWLKELKKSKRILIVYGQNAPLNDEQLNSLNSFASKFNCVIATDFLSNIDCRYSVSPYNLLQTIPQKEYNEQLAPDILISVGGKRLMNDPLTFKVRNGPGYTRHWSVAPDGKIKDFYFRLTSVLEMTQDNFFNWFSSHSDQDQVNDGEYYEKWLIHVKKHSFPQITNFNAHYIQSKFIPAIPENSILHLGVGQSFYDCRRYEMKKSIHVFCNMGTNGIDGCTSTFLGQCAVVEHKLCFLLVGDLSFFYDMNSIWNKPLNNRIRILLVNNNGTGLLRGHNLKGISSVHNTTAKGWVESTGFKYMSADTKEEFDKKLPEFLSPDSKDPLFFEVLCD